MYEFLKCDAPGCDHRELFGELTADLIGKPCPKCGASLLTQHDFDVWTTRFRPAIELGKELGILVDASSATGKPLSVGYHEGVTTIEELREEAAE